MAIKPFLAAPLKETHETPFLSLSLHIKTIMSDIDKS